MKPRVHDLRHTAASWWIQAGIPLPVIQRQRGHESIITTVNTYGASTGGQPRPPLTSSREFWIPARWLLKALRKPSRRLLGISPTAAHAGRRQSDMSAA
ncbi:tyrosine-type recombinase/integrase [Mycobacterium hackensackense]|uniref:tyrosine-type recombinase/integrase n=1 Tax=Mycobacterium hackensackense TaxID=228909 RepID=UPI002265D5B9|nr:tyrosine-type recombinase/integrase [Mycobacterium hackensackense]